MSIPVRIQFAERSSKSHIHESWNRMDTGSLMSKLRGWQYWAIKFSETRQPPASCFIILKGPTASSWSAMCSGHCFSVPRSSVKGAGEGSSLWNPSTYIPLVRPRHMAMPAYKRWLKNVILRYAGDRVCSWSPGVLETTNTDTGVSYWQ